ncbi:MAG: 50S ribosomal protein L20 [Saprospiraceae bacterium]|nr:50S ribosomal protein L20 [Saprospiraceae bacterium]
MPRSVNSVAAKARRKKILKAARGYFSGRSKVYTVAKNAVERAMKYAFIHRRQKKRAFRRLWIARINAAVRPFGINYSRFIDKLNKSNIIINRKVLADLALHHPASFKAIVDQVHQ